MNIPRTVFILFAILAVPGCKRASSPVVGTWQFQQSGGLFNSTSVNVVQKLTADGKMTMRFQVGNSLVGSAGDESVSGTWSLEGDQLLLKSDTEKGVILRTLVAHTKDSLTLRAPDGSTEQYMRIGDPE